MATCTGEELRKAVAAFLRSDLISMRICPDGTVEYYPAPAPEPPSWEREAKGFREDSTGQLRMV